MGGHAKNRLPRMFAGMPSWLRATGTEPVGSGEAEPEGKRKKKGPALSGQARLLLLVNALFILGNALSGTFVNVYLWKAKNDFALIGWYAVSTQLMMAVTFWLGGKWVKEHNKMNALRSGVAVSALFYGLVLLLGSAAVKFVLLLGAVQGISTGFFWLAFNVVYFEVTDPENRDRFNGYAGLLGSTAGMLAPWFSGWVISRMASASGYRLIFSISLGVFVLGVVASFFLKKRKVKGHYEWSYGFRQLKGPDSKWRTIFMAMVSQGVREGVFGFMIALMVYISTKNEMRVGSFSLITSAVALVSFYLAGRLLKPRYRYAGMLVGALAIILVIVPFFWSVRYGTLLIFGIGTSLFFPLYTIPLTSVVFDIIGQTAESASHRVEYIVLREVGLNSGRLLGTLTFISVVSFTISPLAISLLLLVIGSSPLAVWFFMRGWLVSQNKIQK